MSNKGQQKTTEINDKTAVSTITGLTPTQEQAAILLASGESVTAVANRLNINRSTIYDWQKLITYRCFYNRQCEEYRNTLTNGLLGLAQEAFKVIQDSLHSNNEQTRLKAAIWLTERFSNFSIGKTDVREALKAECTHPLIKWETEEVKFDEAEYKKKLYALGLSES